ncbi:MAG: glycosyltransferase family 2 protein, partial [Betaproteobacteria bacterium]|nr:glycosyltransferase family 2 protein [Betaproteobacteria bacterium]
MPSTPMPLVSVVVRSMDRPTLARALASVGNQTYSQVEVVVVNARGAAHSPLPPAGALPVRLVDPGVPLPRSRAANVGLQAARGDLLVLLDDDDWFDPPHLERLVAALRQHQDSVAAYAGVRCLHEENGAVTEGRVFDEPFDPVRLLA